MIKRLAVAKKGIYDGLAAVEQAPSSELAEGIRGHSKHDYVRQGEEGGTGA